MKGILSLLVASVFGIWLIGGIATYIYDAVDHKATCIDQEGWLKGIFWCDADPRSQTEMSSHHIADLIRAAIWPYRLFANGKGEEISHVYEPDDQSIDYEPKMRELVKKSCAQAQYSVMITNMQLEEGKSVEEIKQQMGEVFSEYESVLEDPGLSQLLDLRLMQAGMEIALRPDGKLEDKMTEMYQQCISLWEAMLPTMDLDYAES